MIPKIGPSLGKERKSGNVINRGKGGKRLGQGEPGDKKQKRAFFRRR